MKLYNIKLNNQLLKVYNILILLRLLALSITFISIIISIIIAIVLNL